MSVRPGEGEPDSVWVTVEFPLALPVVQEFFADTERLLRLHPHLEIATWRARPEGGFILLGHNETTGSKLRTELQRRDGDPAAGFTLAYDQGLKRESVFRWAPAPIPIGAGSQLTHLIHLTVTEYYRPWPAPTIGAPSKSIAR